MATANFQQPINNNTTSGSSSAVICKPGKIVTFKENQKEAMVTNVVPLRMHTVVEVSSTLEQSLIASCQSSAHQPKKMQHQEADLTTKRMLFPPSELNPERTKQSFEVADKPTMMTTTTTKITTE